MSPRRKMHLCRNLLIAALWLIAVQTINADNAKPNSKEASAPQLAPRPKDDNSKENPARAVADNAFEKRQGLAIIDDEEDQLAMESQVHDQMALESGGSRDQVALEGRNNQIQIQQAHGQQIPVPIQMRNVPANIVFPLPPQGHGQQGQQNGHSGHQMPFLGMRAPPPPQQQGQQSSPQQVVFHQVPTSQGQGQQGPPPQFFQQFLQKQQQQQFRGPTQGPQIVSTPSGDVVIQKANEIGQAHGHHGHPSGLVPPLPHPQGQQGQRFINGNVQQAQQMQQQGKGLSSSEITKNIIRELFDRKPPGMTDGRPNGGFFAAPQQQQQPQAPQTIQGKVLNRPQIPPQAHVKRPAPSNGGLFSNPKEIALSTNDLNAEGDAISPAINLNYGADRGDLAPGWPNSGPDGDTPKIVSLEVKCEKNVMRVFVAFDKPFFGVIFSKGHYHNVNCIHLPAGLGHTSANFDVSIEACGTTGNTENGLYGYGLQSGSGSYFENTIVIQYDSQVQEVWDQARKLRCTWHDQYEKSVTFRPFPVDEMDVVRADFAGDNVGCWMQIQVGKGPWASEVSGLVKIGQTMTMVLAIKDDDNKFDMMVRNCLAHDGQRAPIQLVDQFGCITRPKLMSPFTKINNFGQSATVLSYAHFQAFKFPDSMEVHFQCTIQICRHQCPEQCSPGQGVGKSGLPAPGDRDESAARRKRSANESEILGEFEYQTTFKTLQNEDVGLNKIITVISPDDLDFSAENLENSREEETSFGTVVEENIVCMSSMGFAAMITLLIGLLLIACIISAVIVIKRRPSGNNLSNLNYYGGCTSSKGGSSRKGF